MFGTFLKRMFGSANDRFIKSLHPLVQKINQLEPTFQAFSDQQLQAQTPHLRERLQKGEILNDLLPEAFATVREAARRVLGMRHFDVQLMGGIILHRGMIAEMMTGEGKTLASTLPSYLNALTGKGVHIVTVNDYLAQRDSQEMGKIYTFLGLRVGCILNELNDEERQQAYAADITYATNNELGFDYLRDNMKFRRTDMVQRPFHYAIVDEVDSILIDEARTPLIISGMAEDSSDLYRQVNIIIPYLSDEDFEKDEKARSVTLTEKGSQKVEELLEKHGLLRGGSLYDIHNISLVHHANQALKAHKLFQRDVDYIVKDDKIIIIDEFTGRMMDGRRYSEGLHQALEAKEGVSIQMENQTLASITFQNYFRMYEKLAGMTGTAMTEAAEFADIYKLEVIHVPTNLPLQRKDEDDEVYRTAREKHIAIIKLIKECHQRGQPVLVGTTSIEKSELISRLLETDHIPHHVLNARYHAQEAYIIAQAGVPGAVTVATNMAGRGTDIKLGGNLEMRLARELEGVANPAERAQIEATVKEKVKADQAKALGAGGLYVIATERHESRRIDNQLRGRSGRQGDPGASKFFLSLEDDLMRIFGSERLDAMLKKLGLEEGEAIVHRWINKALERAQQRVEARNYEIRKHLLKYDDVMNDQRKVIYSQRIELMETDDASQVIMGMRDDVLDRMLVDTIPAGTYADQWNIPLLHEECLRLLNLDLPLAAWSEEEGIAENEIRDRILTAHNDKLEGKTRNVGADRMRLAEKSILLRILDQCWKEHLLALDHLRQGINLRAYAQRDPLNEYKTEAFLLFQQMLDRVRELTISTLSYLEIPEEPTSSIFDILLQEAQINPSKLNLQGVDLDALLAEKVTALMPESFPGPEGEKRSINLKKKGGKKAATPSGSRISKAAKDGKAPDPAVLSASKEKKRSRVKELGVKVGSMPTPAMRNAPCPCGSGLRYKNCHGKIQ